ncbi:uncharacterized protein [Pseudorasbora parva]|uniref:uncharacterized protein n=1 Tax=Pseudorasbora parva TaxID=51549 RepID=UPI00351DB7FE
MKLSLSPLGLWTFISRMISLGIMSRQKQNLLWLMIVCCASEQISSSKIMIIGDNLTNAYFENLNNSACSAVNLTCPSACEILIGNFCIMTVKPNSMLQGQCKTSKNIYFFNITNNWGRYEIRTKEILEDIKIWILPNVFKCLPSAVLISTAKSVVVCEGESASIQCDTGCIKVLNANYGRTDSTVCATGKQADQLSNNNCKKAESLSIMSAKWDLSDHQQPDNYNPHRKHLKYHNTDPHQQQCSYSMPKHK